jgi:hypothetical protein
MAFISPIHSADIFKWEKGIGVAEVSDIRRPVAGRLYDDACDIGFRLLSSKTHKIEAFYLAKEDKDGSGEDVYGWHFYPVNRELRDAGVRILLIND